MSQEDKHAPPLDTAAGLLLMLTAFNRKLRIIVLKQYQNCDMLIMVNWLWNCVSYVIFYWPPEKKI